jgi:8-oxo-dGTP pyrophosphatase MutT (NUDIX family)
MKFERIATEAKFEGRIVTVREDTFRYEDGKTADREIIGHQGAVGVVAHDDRDIWLVRQPREAIGSPDLLELPAGKLDVEGEQPLETAKRELAEEIAKGADTWDHLHTYWSSPGFTDEKVYVYLATGLHDVDQPDSGEDERIEIVKWPLTDLDALIDEVTDAKTLVGLLELRRRRS